MQYEAEYHRVVHDYLHDPALYERFSRIHRRRYFEGIAVHHAVFEFGCGLGQNLFGLPAHKKMGYDISEYAREFCKQKGLTVVGTLEAVPTDAFDVVISRHSLEHLEDPFQNLMLLRSFLRPGGWLILILPEERPSMLRSYAPDVDNHLFSWTPRTLANLLHHARFTVRSIRREPNSGLRFFSRTADWSYPLLRFAMRSTDLLRSVPGEWVAEAYPR
jgi:SAM-dependent methyltransferase